MGALKTASAILFLVYLAKGDVIVETKSGKVAGVEVDSILKDEKYYSFLSIPYAEPPVGSLRFMVRVIYYSLYLLFITVQC